MIKFIKKNYSTILMTLSFALFVSFIVIAISYFCEISDLLLLFAIIIFLFDLFVILFLIIARIGILTIKTSYNNIKYCEIDCFEKIDALKSFWNNDKSNNYKRQISYINYSYSKDGPVGKLISEDNLADLYVRKDFLNNSMNFFKDFISCFFTCISTIAFSLLPEDIIDVDKIILDIFTAIICLICFVFLKYGEKKEFKSYKKFVKEYELKLLDKAIESIYNKCEMKREDENLLFTQQYVLKYLINLHGKFSTGINKKKEIEADIDCVENLNLFVDDYSSFKIKEYDFIDTKKVDERINLKKIYILYEKDNDKKFANEDFEKLFDIITKNNIIKL